MNALRKLVRTRTNILVGGLIVGLMSLIALIAPFAKINVIKDYEVIEKKQLSLPERFTGIVKCPNPKCVTNNEPMKTSFEVISSKPIILKCHYCEREIQQEDIQLM